MPNPNPVQTKELKAKQFKPLVTPDGVLAKKNAAVKLPVKYQEQLDQLPSDVRVHLMRTAIANALNGLGDVPLCDIEALKRENEELKAKADKYYEAWKEQRRKIERMNKQIKRLKGYAP